MWVLALDGRNGMRGARRVAQGALHGLTLSPRDLLRAALQDAATAIILVHNHPSGDPTPSRADIEMTKEIVTAAKAMGLMVHDHLVIGKGKHASFKSLGII